MGSFDLPSIVFDAKQNPFPEKFLIFPEEYPVTPPNSINCTSSGIRNLELFLLLANCFDPYNVVSISEQMSMSRKLCNQSPFFVFTKKTGGPGSNKMKVICTSNAPVLHPGERNYF